MPKSPKHLNIVFALTIVNYGVVWRSPHNIIEVAKIIRLRLTAKMEKRNHSGEGIFFASHPFLLSSPILFISADGFASPSLIF